MRHVIIIGGGYAGVKALHTLARSGEPLRITLFDRHPYHYLQTEAYELVGNSCTISEVTIDLAALAYSYGENVVFKKRSVDRIDFDAKSLRAEGETYTYDYLIVAAGSRTRYGRDMLHRPATAHGVKSLEHALEFRQRFEQQLFDRMESEHGLCHRPFTIVVGGSGLSGVEIVAEIAHHARRFYEQNTLLCDNIDIYLVGSSPEILRGMEPYLVQSAVKRLKKLGVRMLNGTRIAELQEGKVLLNNGETIAYDFMILTFGIVASTLTRSLGIDLNSKGQIRVEPTLQVPGIPSVYAVGDAAELHDLRGGIIPPTAQAAEQSGVIAAENVLAAIRGQRIQAADLKMRGTMIALGGPWAAVSLLGWLRISGRAGYWIKRFIYAVYTRPLNRRCRRGAAVAEAKMRQGSAL
jgi:NADH:ubiquinone reductase (H+-translocating)